MCIFVILLLCTSFPCVYSLSSVCLAACFGEIKMFIMVNRRLFIAESVAESRWSVFTTELKLQPQTFEPNAKQIPRRVQCKPRKFAIEILQQVAERLKHSDAFERSQDKFAL